MFQVEYTRHAANPIDAVRVVPFCKPALGRDQVWVEVLAAPINPSDLQMISGDYYMGPQLPAVAGNAGVGRVAEIGADVESVAVGDIVPLVRVGTWRTHAVLDAADLTPLPSMFDPKQLATLVINPPTAYLLLTSIVKVEPGDWVLQNAANSDVGKSVVAIAKDRGIRTVNVVAHERAAAALKARGADVVLVDGDDLPARVAAATGGAPVRLGFECVGGSATLRLGRSLSPGGTLVFYGDTSMEPPAVDPGNLIFEGLTLRGFWLGHWYQATTAEERQLVFWLLLQLVNRGVLRCDIAAEYDVPDIKEAIAAAMRRGRDGKIFIVPRHAT
jgi:NADPH:quinone reductase-like Zn-dependent oxidoreductase